MKIAILFAAFFIIAADIYSQSTECLSKAGLLNSYPHALKRIVNGNYEFFDIKRHAWPFYNTEDNMWPEEWWKQFDYWVPPYTKWWTVKTQSRIFPDWPLFTDTFTDEYCYLDSPKNSYPTLFGEEKWRDLYEVWGGSCYGIAQATFMAFDDPDRFAANFPVGDVTYANDVGMNDDLRKVINMFFLYQFGQAQMEFDLENIKKTPSEVIDDLKAMFDSEERDDSPISIFNYDSTGGHAMNPFLLKEGIGIDTIVVYDNNRDNEGFIFIDKLMNTWFYRDYYGSNMMYLDVPSSTNYTKPEPVNLLTSKYRGSSHLQIYNYLGATTTLENSSGKKIGYDASTWRATNELSDGMPIILKNGKVTPPIGYYIPKDDYSIRIDSFKDTLSYFTVMSEQDILKFERHDAENSQIDFLRYSEGLSVSNKDNGEKNIMMYAISHDDQNEYAFKAENIHIIQNDSISFNIYNEKNFKFMNAGNQKTYDLKLILNSPDMRAVCVFKDIDLPAVSTHEIRPDWNNILTSHLPIYIDSGNNGTVDDSLFVNIDTTMVGVDDENILPEENKLFQNYPNPFNPATKIRYQIASEGNIKLVIYDILGREIATLADEYKFAGNYEAKFDASQLPSGIYFYRLTFQPNKMVTSVFVQTRKMILIK